MTCKSENWLRGCWKCSSFGRFRIKGTFLTLRDMNDDEYAGLCGECGSKLVTMPMGYLLVEDGEDAIKRSRIWRCGKCLEVSGFCSDGNTYLRDERTAIGDWSWGNCKGCGDVLGEEVDDMPYGYLLLRGE